MGIMSDLILECYHVKEFIVYFLSEKWSGGGGGGGGALKGFEFSLSGTIGLVTDAMHC